MLKKVTQEKKITKYKCGTVEYMFITENSEL